MLNPRDTARAVSSQLFEEATDRMEEGDYANAIEKLNEAITFDPRNPRYYLTKAEALAALGEENASLKTATTGVSFDTEGPRTRAHFGVVLYRLDKFEDALKEFDYSLKKRPDEFLALYFKGLALSELNRDDDALKVLNRASVLEPEDPWPHFKIAELLYDQNQLKPALRELNLGLKMDRANEYYRIMRVDVLDEMGKEKEAMDEIERSIRAIPDSADLTIIKADRLFDSGRYDDSINTLLNFLGSRDFDVDVLLEVSKKTRSLGMQEKALEFIDKSLSIVDIEEVKLEKLEILGELKRYDESLKLAEEWISKDENSFMLRSEKTHLLLDLEKLEEAERYARETYHLFPDLPDAITLVVHCIELLGKDDEIIQIIQEFMLKNGEEPSLLRDMASAFGRSDRYDEQGASLKKLIQLVGENYLDLMSLTGSLINSGKLQEASSTLDKVEPLDNLDAFPTLLRARIVVAQGGCDRALTVLNESRREEMRRQLCYLAKMELEQARTGIEQELFTRFINESCTNVSMDFSEGPASNKEATA